MGFEGRRLQIRGTVQGVGFRPWVYRVATALGVAGRVRNDGAGVTIEAFAPSGALDRFLAQLNATVPPTAHIDSLQVASIPAEPASHFEVVASQASAERRVSIPADLATCDDCLRELFDPVDRRFRYPFINCTNCGPRFTIASDVPYDRAATSMASFQLCRTCQAEYDDPANRRFHAQPNACPICGPRLAVTGGEGDPLTLAGLTIRNGGIVALKGIGGYHLACDATAPGAVRTLRTRKHRDAKPFALMVRDLPAARALADISEAEARLLQSPERPIVLVQRRPIANVAEEVAPDTPWLGIMLAYSPLHHLLLADVERPLVMTSGNVSDEPIAFQDDDAQVRLKGLADVILSNDREILSRCDDSVARVIAGAPVVLRRSRGWVPRAVTLDRPVSEPILGCGALLKNTFCLVASDTAFLGPHLGDLDHLEIFEAYEEAIDRLERFVGVHPEVVAHDLHPDYASTTYALQRPARVRIGVQHHHAHVASAMAEHHLTGPVLGVAWDGAGYGTDGTSWGGEFLLATASGYERLATLRPIALPGGDKAIKQVWRLATTLLDDAFEGSPPLDQLALFQQLRANDIDLVREIARGSINTPLAHGAGRYFDAIGALVLGRCEARYEGEVAVALNAMATAGTVAPYPWTIGSSSPLEIDLRPTVRALVSDLLSGTDAAQIASRFHDTLADVIVGVAGSLRATHGSHAVILTGGCFQNPRLTEAAREGLLQRGHEVLLHSNVPPGDGGIALGQAIVADALMR